jgi:hypothetical protein
VEIAACYRATCNADGDIPHRYRKIGYLAVRTFLGLAGGALAEVFDASTAMASFYLGASAPIVIDKLAQGAIPSIPSHGTSPE